MKMEKGEKDTDYVAYTLNNETQIVKTAKSITQTITENYEDLDGKYENLSSEVKQTATELTSTITSTKEELQENIDGVSDDLTTATQNWSSQLKQTASEISTKVEKDGVISAINQSAESIKISADKITLEGNTLINAINNGTVQINANKINLSGYVTASSLTSSGTTNIDGSRITSGTIQGVTLISKTSSNRYIKVANASVTGGVGDTECGAIYFGNQHYSSVDNAYHKNLRFDADFILLSANRFCISEDYGSTNFTRCSHTYDMKYVVNVDFDTSTGLIRSVTEATVKFRGGLCITGSN
jgi:predicted phage tail protein